MLSVANSQGPPRRLQIPGAIPVGGPIHEARPLPYRRVLPAVPAHALQPLPARIRSRPPALQPVRPVFEQPEEDDDGPLSRDEVARLHNIPLISGPPPQLAQAAPRPQPVQRPQPPPQRALEEDDEEENIPVQRSQPQPIQFR